MWSDSNKKFVRLIAKSDKDNIIVSFCIRSYIVCTFKFVCWNGMTHVLPIDTRCDTRVLSQNRVKWKGNVSMYNLWIFRIKWLYALVYWILFKVIVCSKQIFCGIHEKCRKHHILYSFRVRFVFPFSYILSYVRVFDIYSHAILLY